jgi:hypothetical protein
MPDDIRESGDKPTTNLEGLQAEPTIVVKEKDWIRLETDLAECRELSEQRRVLLEKHHYKVVVLDVDVALGEKTTLLKREVCVECGVEAGYGDKPDCAWAAAIEGE